ncbi:hypothetical protein M434DRAFT_378737 [Hypoxylon sp. CO27-5]|nr:hypothetical protein M434DRAFT_378737 [Hypoxylon sp. CO27-5]
MASKGKSKVGGLDAEENQDKKHDETVTPNTDNASGETNDVEDINPSNIVEHACRYRVGLYAQGALIHQHLEDIEEKQYQHDDIKEHVYDKGFKIMNELRGDLRRMEDTLNSLSQQRLRSRIDIWDYEAQLEEREEIPELPTREMNPRVLQQLGLGDLAELVTTEITKRFWRQESLPRIDADAEHIRHLLAVIRGEVPASDLENQPTDCSARLLRMGDSVRNLKILDKRINAQVSAIMSSISASVAGPSTAAPKETPKKTTSKEIPKSSVPVVVVTETSTPAAPGTPFNTPASTTTLNTPASTPASKDAISEVTSDVSNAEASSKATTATAEVDASSETPASAEELEVPMTAKERQRKKKSAKRAERRRRQRAEALDREEDQE